MWSSSPEQKISFVCVSLAALPTNISSSGQESMCWVTHPCHARSQDRMTTRTVPCYGWSTLVKTSPVIIRLAEIWLKWSNLLFALIPHDRCGWLRNQGSCCPKYLPCLFTEDKKSSCLCCKMGAIQVKLWGKVRPKPPMMVSCSLHALCWSGHQVRQLSERFPAHKK